MTRAINNVAAKAKKKKILGLAKGFRGRAKNCFTIAKERVEKALTYAYRDRKNRKRDFRVLWIQRVNAGVKGHGLTYSQFIDGLNKMDININRKMLSEMAIREEDSFNRLVELVKNNA
ncbi:MAG: 50S ribosomal protein L20 [Rickettsiales bacterium]|jgi:large subunit ribosomal protein L20|nr:50S ribosomal protein L20 [Rickettsiales bacterium]